LLLTGEFLGYSLHSTVISSQLQLRVRGAGIPADQIKANR